jgi:hypothetical protein
MKEEEKEKKTKGRHESRGGGVGDWKVCGEKERGKAEDG